MTDKKACHAGVWNVLTMVRVYLSRHRRQCQLQLHQLKRGSLDPEKARRAEELVDMFDYVS